MTNTIKALVLAALLTTSGCAALKSMAPTILDVATVLCEAFATDQPAAFAAHVQAVSSPETREEVGVSARDLCRIPEVIKPFVSIAKSNMETAGAALSSPK